MTKNVQLTDSIERVIILTVDCLRWDHYDRYRDIYPPGVWFRGTPQATFTAPSHASLYTGLNPPRHGVYTFNDSLVPDETLFSATESVSFSNTTTDEDCVIADIEADSRGLHEFRNWLDGRPDDADELLEAIADHELTMLHDWLVHDTGPRVDIDAEVYQTDKDSPSANLHQYDKQVGLSIDAHERILEALAERGLYENTLFVVWGDHGQAVRSPPFFLDDHAHHPEEEVARVPFGFCSTAFEDTTIDVETNPRSVDVVPTLQTVMRESGLRFDDLSHETEGVDLTRFDGELVGYTISRLTQFNGRGDGVRTANHAYIWDREKDYLLETYAVPDVENGCRLQEVVLNDTLRSRLELYYEKARNDHDELVYRRAQNEEFLREMGYLG